MPKREKSKSKHMEVKWWEKYEISSQGLKRKVQFCPKCKSGLAVHKNRVHCGKCGFAELKAS